MPMFTGLAYAMGGKADGGAGAMASLIPLLLMFVIFYFLLIRPQQKTARKHQDFVKGLKTGDRVVTTGGLHGIVVDAQEDVVVLRVAPKMDLTVQKSSISSVVGKVSQDDQKRLEREKAPAELDATSVETGENAKPS